MTLRCYLHGAFISTYATGSSVQDVSCVSFPKVARAQFYAVLLNNPGESEMSGEKSQFTEEKQNKNKNKKQKLLWLCEQSDSDSSAL